MSVNVEKRVIDPRDDTFVEEAWQLKERIRRAEGVLKQRRGFFTDAYRRSTVYMYRDPDEDAIIGFATARGDGYILFLAVSPDYRGEGFGKQLVADVAENHRKVTCHARTTNENALEFYDYLGFSIVRRIDNYYEDRGDAYYLRLGDDADGLADKISDFFRR